MPQVHHQDRQHDDGGRSACADQTRGDELCAARKHKERKALRRQWWNSLGKRERAEDQTERDHAQKDREHVPDAAPEFLPAAGDLWWLGVMPAHALRR